MKLNFLAYIVYLYLMSVALLFITTACRLNILLLLSLF